MRPVCTACGTSFPDAHEPPAVCPICQDHRQFVPPGGQSWTRMDRIVSEHRALISYDGPFLGIGMAPHFAIGQRAILVRTRTGNVLWDCIPFLDPALIEIIRALGGLQAIAISHPHFYGGMEIWSETFGAPVIVHDDDRSYAQNPPAKTCFWSGAQETVLPGLTIVRCGGHFTGSAVLHVEAGAAGNEHGAILSGDTLQVTPGGTHVSFMRSYPNMIPLPKARVRRMVQTLSRYSFETIVGGFWGRVVTKNGREALTLSAARYCAALEGGCENQTA